MKRLSMRVAGLGVVALLWGPLANAASPEARCERRCVEDKARAEKFCKEYAKNGAPMCIQATQKGKDKCMKSCRDKSAARSAGAGDAP